MMSIAIRYLTDHAFVKSAYELRILPRENQANANRWSITRADVRNRSMAHTARTFRHTVSNKPAYRR